jgi:hypothetical protein
MRRRKIKPGHNPDCYYCKNPECKRTTALSLQSYRGYPHADTPPEQIHYVWQPQYGGFSLHCSACAHYTVVSPHRSIDPDYTPQ